MTEVEQKLRLTRFLREENILNRQKMQSREEILYGISRPGKSRYELLPFLGARADEEAGLYQPGVPGSSTFGLRLVIAVLLFAGVVYMKQNQTHLFGHSVTEVLAQQVCASSEEKLVEFVSNFALAVQK